MLSKRISLEATRFYNLNLNGWRVAGKLAIDKKTAKFEKETESWIQVLGEDGWTPSDQDALSEIAELLSNHVPKPVKIDKLAARKLSRPPRAVTSSLPKASVAKYECLRFLSLNALEWRNIDGSDRPKELAGLAFYVFIAHKLYVKQTEIAVKTDVGLKLREDFLKFLSDNWKVSHSIEPSVVVEKTRTQWDDPILARILTDAPPPKRTREEALVVYDHHQAEARWDTYALDLKKFVMMAKAASFARNTPGEPDTVNSEFAAAMDTAIEVR